MGNINGQFLYTLYATTDSPTGVYTLKGSCNLSRKISNILDIKGETKDSVAPDQVKNIQQQRGLLTYR